MARIPYPVEDELDPDTRAFLARLPPLNIFRLLAGAGGLLPAFARFGNHLLYRSSLDPLLRELAILRVGVLSDAAYEVQQHEAIARQLGMSDALIAATREGPEAAELDEVQGAVVRFTDDVVANVRAGDDTFGALSGTLTTHQLQELTMTIGFYMAVSRYLRTFDVDLEVT